MKKNFLKQLAKTENVTLGFLEKQFALGKAVIPYNKTRRLAKPVVIGQGFKIKVNTNIGISTVKPDLTQELAKLAIAIKAGTDTIMDLSVGTQLSQARKQIIKHSSVALGTVPIYEIASYATNAKIPFEKITFNQIFEFLKQQAQDGVDFFTIHAGILKSSVELIKKKKRTGGIVSRGGALLTRWMYVNKKENPLYENFDQILKLAKEYNIALSLGDALRPGAIADSTDQLQIAELKVLGQLVKRCRRAGVQVMVEGPGHIKLNEIAYNMQLQKKFCHNAPFYVLGPLPTDIAAGYDHITSAIGGAIAALNGADFLCVVTPAEHLRHPSIQDIRDGVIASRIAAHSVDVLRFKKEWQRDYQLSIHRSRRNWEGMYPLMLDPEKAREYRKTSKSSQDLCSMCGDFCSLKIVEKCNLLK